MMRKGVEFSLSDEIVLETEKSDQWFDYPSMDTLSGMSYDELSNSNLEQIKITGKG